MIPKFCMTVSREASWEASVSRTEASRGCRHSRVWLLIDSEAEQLLRLGGVGSPS